MNTKKMAFTLITFSLLAGPVSTTTAAWPSKRDTLETVVGTLMLVTGTSFLYENQTRKTGPVLHGDDAHHINNLVITDNNSRVAIHLPHALRIDTMKIDGNESDVSIDTSTPVEGWQFWGGLLFACAGAVLLKKPIERALNGLWRMINEEQ